MQRYLFCKSISQQKKIVSGAESISEVEMGGSSVWFSLSVILLSGNSGNQAKAHPKEIIRFLFSGLQYFLMIKRYFNKKSVLEILYFDFKYGFSRSKYVRKHILQISTITKNMNTKYFMWTKNTICLF